MGKKATKNAGAEKGQAPRKTWETTDLADALRQKKIELGSYGKLAQKAGISNTSLYKILDGSFEPGQPSSEPGDESERERVHAGFAKTLARLCVYLDPTQKEINALTVALAYGLKDCQRVRDAISETTRHLFKRTDVEDSVMAQIRVREPITPLHREQSQGVIKVGLLPWKPFHAFEDQNSFARNVFGAWVQAANPFAKVDFVDLTGIRDCMDALLGSPSRCDVVFGLYSAPWRILYGLKFIPIDGFASRLSVLTLGGNQVTWAEIIQGTVRNDYHFFVIREELSHLFLQGVCRYDVSRLEITNLTSEDLPSPVTGTNDKGRPTDLATVFAGRIADDMILRYVKGRNAGEPLVLVTDPATCDAVEAAFAKSEVVARHNLTYHREKDPKYSPIYRVGMAVREDAYRWYDILESAKTTELYGNRLFWTVKQYINVLREFQSNDFIWDWKYVPDTYRNEFMKRAKEVFGKNLPAHDAADSEALKEFLKELRKQGATE